MKNVQTIGVETVGERVHDHRMPALLKQRQAKLYPSELVTIGVLCAKRRTLPRLLALVEA
jgi:hypothetical protein